MKRAMAKQAEAERERRAMIIASQGELSASENLMHAADNLSKYPGALHLRTLQTIRDIAADPSEKIVLFLPYNVEALAQTVLGEAQVVPPPPGARPKPAARPQRPTD
jgi:regulator of protease activity HflC (stomatin/prohibitin superfamily)